MLKFLKSFTKKTNDQYNDFSGTDMTMKNYKISAQNKNVDKTIFMADNSKLIDFVLAYVPSKMTPSQTEYREIYERKLLAQGLILEYAEVEESQDGKTAFVKIHAPWEVLARTAEISRIKVPIEKADTFAEESGLAELTDKLIRKISCSKRNPFELEPKFQVPERSRYYTLEFSRAKLGQYLIQDHEHLFPQIQRIWLVWDLLERTMINYNELEQTRLADHKIGQSRGINYFLQQGVYAAAYPLHDGGTHVDEDNKRKKPNSLFPLRPWLYETWARPGRFAKFQPLDEIRNYFGEKIAIYFAWLGFYTTMLFPLAALGLLTFLIGLIFMAFDPPMMDICFTEYGNSTIICRSCQKKACSFEILEDYCSYAVVNGIFNNYFTTIFALATSLWAIFFLELWKRYQARLSCKWDMFDLTEEYEPPRPEYQTHAKKKRRHPITREWEPHISGRSRAQKILSSVATVSFLICIVLVLIVSVIIYKIIMVTIYANMDSGLIETLGSSTFTSLTASVLNAIFIIIMEKVYTRIAWGLTEREFPRTMSDFETSYTYKMYIFQFINYYATLFYLAFLQGHMYTTPASASLLTDKCSPVGCTFSVTTQLCVILIVKQTLNNIVEIGKPWISSWIRRRKNVNVSPENVYARHEKDFDLEPLPYLSLLPEYLEMTLQYGFVTMFGASFPIAALFALLNNIIEIRLDAYKFVASSRRALPARAADIGSWYNILEFITRLAILTNALLIAYTTDVIDRLVFQLTYSKDGTLEGYLDFTLSQFNTSDWADSSLRYDEDFGDVSLCRYRGYYFGPESSEVSYETTPIWWRVNLTKLAFVVVFQNLIFWIQSLIQYLIPDIPDDVQLHVQRNRYVSRISAENFEAEKARKEALRCGIAENPQAASSRLQPGFREGQPSQKGSFSKGKLVNGKRSDPSGVEKGPQPIYYQNQAFHNEDETI